MKPCPEPSYRSFEDSLQSSLSSLCSLVIDEHKKDTRPDLNPSLRRHLATLIFSNPTAFYQSILEHDILGITQKLSSLYATPRITAAFRVLFRAVLHISDFIVLLVSWQILSSRNTKPVTLVFLHHEKYCQYISSFFSTDDSHQIVWLCFGRFPQISCQRPPTDTILKFPRYSLFTHSSPYSHVHSNFQIIKLVLKLLMPHSVVTVEGDAMQHTNLALAARQLSIPSYCLQWGIFDPNWAKIAFSYMSFDFFIVWGAYFRSQLLPLNDIKHYTLASSPFSTVLTAKFPYPSLIFMDQGYDPIFHHSDRRKIISILAELASTLNITVAFRQHPGRPALQDELRFLSSNAVHLESSCIPAPVCLSNYHYCLSIASSSLVEAIYQHIVPIRFKTQAFPHYSVPIPYSNVGLEIDLDANDSVLQLTSYLLLRNHQQYLDFDFHPYEELLFTGRN